MRHYHVVEPFILAALFQILFAIGIKLVGSQSKFGQASKQSEISFVRRLDASQSFGAFTALGVSAVSIPAIDSLTKSTFAVAIAVIAFGSFAYIWSKTPSEYDDLTVFALLSGLNTVIILASLVLGIVAYNVG